MMRLLTAFTTLSLLLLSACATLTEEQKYNVENKRLIAKERFDQAEAACLRMGGVMEMTAKRWGERTHRDYAAAKCIKY